MALLYNIGKTIDKVGRSLGNPLPEFKISERLMGTAHASQPAPTQIGQRPGVDYAGPAAFQQYTNNQQVLGTSNYGGSRAQTLAGGGGAPAGGGAMQQGPSHIDLINQAFDAEQGFLGGEESRVRSQADQSRSLLQNEGAEVEQQFGREKGTRMNELGVRETQRQVEYQQGNSQVKQLLSELQNRHNAQLAHGGGFNSSSRDALGEAFGRQANQSLGNLNNQRTVAFEQIAAEKDKVSTFFANKTSELKLNLQRGLQDIETQLSNQLSKIAGARMESARAKANATMQAWQGYANQRAQLQLEAFNFQKNLEAWAVQKGQSLEQAQQYAVGQTAGFDPGQFTFAPNQSPTVGVGQSQFSTPPTAPVKISRAVGRSPEEDQLQQLGPLPSSIAFA